MLQRWELFGYQDVGTIIVNDRPQLEVLLAKVASKESHKLFFDFPALSQIRGYAYYIDSDRVMLRSNEKFPRFTSLVRYDGKIRIDDSKTVLDGKFIFPPYIVAFRGAALSFMIIWIVGVVAIGFSERSVGGPALLLLLLGVIAFSFIYRLFGNVNTSILAKKPKAKIVEILRLLQLP